MKKICTMLFIAMLVMPALASQAETLIQGRVWYGDNMGSTSEDTPTRKLEYLYDSNNRLMRGIQTGVVERGTEWVPTYYYQYSYNASGDLLMTCSFAYKQEAYSASNDTICYEYNDLHQVTKKTDCAKKTYYLFTYDADGNLSQQVRWKYNNTKKEYVNDLTITYSDFTAGGPQTLTANGTSSYNCYTGQMTYDAQGHKLSEKHWSADATPVLNYAEYWTYDATGFLTRYESKGISNGSEVDASKTEYEKLNDNQTRSTSYTYSNGTWKKSGGSTHVTTYASFDGSQYATQLATPEVDYTNASVKLTFQATEALIPLNNRVEYRIYREATLVGSIQADGSQQYSFTDTLVSNGKHDYYIQTLIDGASSNISNIQQIEMERQYPRATGFKATSSRLTTDGIYYVTLSWTNPAITADLGYTSTNIMKVGSYYDSPMLDGEDIITDPSQQSVEVSFGIDPVQQIYVQINYQGAATQSDLLTVDATTIIGKADEISKKLRVVETWGDAMGNDSGCTKKEITYYGNDNRVQRVGRYSKDLSDGTWSIYEYDVYYYGESGMLEKKWTRKYGAYDYGGMGFKETKDTLRYEHNVEGQLIVEYDIYGDRTEHTYDNAGNRIQSSSFQANAEEPYQTITYSQFAGKDMPQLTISEGSLNSYRWMLETEYNGDGNKTGEKKSTYKSSTSSYSPSQYEMWVYDESGELVGDTVYTIKLSNDIETYSYKSYTSYEVEEGNSNRIKVVKRVWDSILKKWGNPKTWNVYEYAEIDASRYAPVLTLEPLGTLANSIRLMVDIPESQRSAMTAFNLYRDGIELAHAVGYYDDDHFIADESGFNGYWYFDDKLVKNGSYDYFVEFCKLDNTMSQISSIGNISNIISQTFDCQLPAPTNLHEVSRRETTTSNSEADTDDRNIFVTLAWDTPANAAEYGFERYNVMLTTSQIAENYEEEGTANSYEVAMRGLEECEVYVMAVYAIGRASSDTLTLSADAAAIQQLFGMKEGDCLIFNQQGQYMGMKRQGEPVSADLPEGNYILLDADRKAQKINVTR